VLPAKGRDAGEGGGGDLALGCGPWLLAWPHGRKAAVLGWPGQRPLLGDALHPRRVSPLADDSVRGGGWLSGSAGLAVAAFGAGGAAGGVLGGGWTSKRRLQMVAAALSYSRRAVAVSAGLRP
jgi:anti-sigma factor RsiW